MTPRRGAGPGPLDVPVARLAEGYRTGRWDPVTVVTESHDRLERVGVGLGAVTEVLDRDLEEARRRSEELAAGHDRGPLHGVPVVVKELIDLAGCHRTAGSAVRPANWAEPAAEDAPVIASLRAAGAIPVARGRTHEFAWGITSRHPDGGGVVNPLDPTRIAGGSSGGVAALVAAGCAPIGVGTDTGGSVRIPASFCGLTGWKPAVGRVSTRGVVPLAPTFDHVGVLAARLPDVIAVDEVLGAGLVGAFRDGSGDVSALRVARLEDASLPPPGAAAVEALDRVCERAGVSGILHAGPAPADLPAAASLVASYGVLQRAEALSVHRDLLRTWPDQAAAYGSDVAGRLRQAQDLDPAAVVEARLACRDAQAAYHRAFAAAEIDAVVLPAAACGPSTVGDPDHVVVAGRTMTLRDAVMPFTIPANVTGWPALVLPVVLSAADAPPPSCQIVVRPGREHLLPTFVAGLRL